MVGRTKKRRTTTKLTVFRLGGLTKSGWIPGGGARAGLFSSF